MLINKRNIDQFFYIFVTGHLFVWTLAPSLTNINLPLDTIEALAWGSNLDWGFNKHPPASAFFVEFFYQIFGAQDWAFYLLSQLFIVIAFFVVWKLSQDFLKNKFYSLISVLLLEGVYFYNYTTPEFNVYVCEIPFWALTVFFCYRFINKSNIKNSFLFGFFAAIGFLSHYLFGYLLLSIFIFFIFNFIKQKKFNVNYLFVLGIFIIMILPHFVWLVDNDYSTISYAIHRTGLENASFLNHLIYPFTFLLKQIGILIPFWIMIFFIIKKYKIKINLKDKKLLFLFFVNILPIILVATTSLITGAKIKTMWMTPFYLFIGLFVVYIFQSQINLKKINNFFSILLFLFIFSPFVYSFVSIANNDKRTDYPGKKIAEKVQKKWDLEFNDPLNVVLGNEWNAGNLSYHLKSRPVWDGVVDKNKLDSYNKFICIDDICVGNK